MLRSRAMRKLLASSLLLALALTTACKNKDATPPGTTILNWDQTKATRPTFVAAKAGTHAVKNVTINWPTAIGGVVVMSLRVETATVEFDEGKDHVTQTSPVAVSAKLIENGDWTASGKCDGPDYQMPSVNGDGGLTTPMGMVLDCSINVQKPPSNEILSLRITGDGKIEPWGTDKPVSIK
jgi:hypothetical protein